MFHRRAVTQGEAGHHSLQTTCHEYVSRGTRLGSVRNCTDDGISEHLEGRAWDWNVNVKNPTQFAQAAQLLTWLTNDNGYNARRLGIMYIGYNAKIWGAYRVSEGWRPLQQQQRAHRSRALLVHVERCHGPHILLDRHCRRGRLRTLPPVRGTTSPIWTHPNPTPCVNPPALPASLKKAKRLWRGSTGTNVIRVQKKLKVKSEAGFFGAAPAKAVSKYQKRKHLPRTGVVDAATWYALKMNKKVKNRPATSALRRYDQFCHSRAVAKRSSALVRPHSPDNALNLVRRCGFGRESALNLWQCNVTRHIDNWTGNFDVVPARK